MPNIIDGSLPVVQARTAILTCMDDRVDPMKLLGLPPGDAHVIRNAGGRATDDAIRSLVVSVTVMEKPEIFVIHHTACVMGWVTNEQLRNLARRKSRIDVSQLDFLAFTDLDESVREDVSKITSSSFIDDSVVVTGYVYDLSSSQLREICRR